VFFSVANKRIFLVFLGPLNQPNPYRHLFEQVEYLFHRLCAVLGPKLASKEVLLVQENSSDLKPQKGAKQLHVLAPEII